MVKPIGRVLQRYARGWTSGKLGTGRRVMVKRHGLGKVPGSGKSSNIKVHKKKRYIQSLKHLSQKFHGLQVWERAVETALLTKWENPFL